MEASPLNPAIFSPKPRVLLVDDNVEVADLIKLGLEFEHFAKVDVWNDPVQCLTNYKPGAYDIIFLDVEMPRMDGFEVYRELKRIDKQARICFLTAFDSPESTFSELFHEAKIERFLKKPITLVNLKREITQVLIASA